jgi:hypothetical protein
LQFEARALVKHADGRACGLLIGSLSAANVTGPLAQFQHRRFERDEVFHLLKDINGRLEAPLPPESLTAIVSKWWPDIEAEYTATLSAKPRTELKTERSERELLEELVVRIRGLEFSQQVERSTTEASASDVLARPITYDSIAWYTLWKFPGLPISEKVQAILFRDLDLRKYLRVEDLDKVVEMARPAVEQYALENPAWFKTGTDFLTKSLGFIDLDFRTRHGFAARTRQAFEQHESLIRKI